MRYLHLRVSIPKHFTLSYISTLYSYRLNVTKYSQNNETSHDEAQLTNFTYSWGEILRPFKTAANFLGNSPSSECGAITKVHAIHSNICKMIRT